MTVPNLPQSESPINSETSIKTETENVSVDAAITDEMDISKGRKKPTKTDTKIEVTLEKRKESNDAANDLQEI